MHVSRVGVATRDQHEASQAEVPFNTPPQNIADSLQKHPPQKTSWTLSARQKILQNGLQHPSTQSLNGTDKEGKRASTISTPILIILVVNQNFLYYLRQCSRMSVTRSCAAKLLGMRKELGVSQRLSHRSRCNNALSPSSLVSSDYGWILAKSEYVPPVYILQSNQNLVFYRISLIGRVTHSRGVTHVDHP